MDSIVVDNVIYSEPTPLDRMAPRGGGGGEDPPLPPRPSSAQQANSNEKETYYQAPVDTLGRGMELQIQHQQQQRSLSARGREWELEKKRMNMHEKTLSQKQHLQGAAVPFDEGGSGSGGGGGHRRTRSGGHVIDNEEYSTPWDVQEEQQRRSSGLPLKPPRAKKPGAGKGIPATPNDGSDNFIPLSPPAVLSTSQDRSKSASPIPPRSPIPSATESEYDDPWDVKNRKISKVIPSQHSRHHTHSVHDRRSPPPSQLAGGQRARQSVGSRIEHSRQSEEFRPARAKSERNHHHSAGMVDTTDPFRPRTSTDVHCPILSVSNPNSPRTSSVSMPTSTHPIQRRPLPEEPGGGSGTSSGPPTPATNPIRRETSPSSVWFDSQLALEEQT